MNHLKELLKGVTPEILKTVVKMNRAMKVHSSSQSRQQTMDQDLLEETRLISDRLSMLDLMPKNSVVAEIGVAEGEFSREILRRSNPVKLYLIDPWDSEFVDIYSEKIMERVKSSMKKEIEDGVVELMRGYSSEILSNISDNYFDWVYVDAAHDYDNVKKDLESCYRVVRSGGLISGHDYIRWVSPTDRYGVVEAVNEFANKTRSKLVFLTNQFDKHDSFALQITK